MYFIETLKESRDNSHPMNQKKFMFFFILLCIILKEKIICTKFIKYVFQKRLFNNENM